MKNLIFDSSSIVTLSLNNLLDVLRLLKKEFDGRFLITPDVKREIVDRPLEIRKFELEALMISKLINEKVLEVVQNNGLNKKLAEIYENANTSYFTNSENIRLIHYGEASCLALASLLPDSVIVVDERTMRMLCEKPESLRKLMEVKLHSSIRMNKDKVALFSDFKIIRSSELAYVALKKGFIEFPAKEEKVLDALLYALKFKGCAISGEEIEEIKHL